MLISRIDALDTSNQEFATTRAARALSTTGGGFSEYLARVMDAEYESFADESWTSEYAAPGVLAEQYPLQDGQTYAPGNELVDHERPTEGMKSTQPAINGTSEKTRDAKPSDESRPGGPKAAVSNADQQPGAAPGAAEAGAGTQVSKARGQEAGQHAGDEGEGPRSVAAARTSKSPAKPDQLPTLQEASAAQGAKEKQPAGAGLEDATRKADALRTTNIVDIPVYLDRSPATGSPERAKASRETGRAKAGTIAAVATREIHSGDVAKQKGADGAEKSARLEVRDLRQVQAAAGGKHQAGSENEAATSGGKSAAALTTSQTTGVPAEREAGQADTFETLLGRAGGNDGATVRPQGAVIRTHAENPALHTLRQALNDQVNGEIVRAARLVVRGNDTGEIRLHLKPESLGNVRIMLQMQEGHIAGRIIVENSSVREVFEQNLASLIRAFEESGLEAGALDVTLADAGNGSNDRSDGGRHVRAVRELDRAVPVVDSFDDFHDLVDLVV